MSQKMNVVFCCHCQMYQVHIVKKAKKWQCKVCGEKQSFAKVFYEGTGKDCRLVVQNLNFSKSNEPLEPDLNSCDYLSDTSEEFFNESGLISSSKTLATDPTNNSTFSSANLFHNTISKKENSGSLKEPAFDRNNDYTNVSQLGESLAYQFQEKNFQDVELNVNKFYFNYSSVSSSKDGKIENSITDKEIEDKENVSSNRKSGKRCSDYDDDFSIPIKRAKRETSFADLIEESDSDNPEESETVECKANCSIFESNSEIDFSLDF